MSYETGAISDLFRKRYDESSFLVILRREGLRVRVLDTFRSGFVVRWLCRLSLRIYSKINTSSSIFTSCSYALVS